MPLSLNINSVWPPDVIRYHNNCPNIGRNLAAIAKTTIWQNHVQRIWEVAWMGLKASEGCWQCSICDSSSPRGSCLTTILNFLVQVDGELTGTRQSWHRPCYPCSKGFYIVRVYINLLYPAWRPKILCRAKPPTPDHQNWKVVRMIWNWWN